MGERESESVREGVSEGVREGESGIFKGDRGRVRARQGLGVCE
jgi:hypothetical protein